LSETPEGYGPPRGPEPTWPIQEPIQEPIQGPYQGPGYSTGWATGAAEPYPYPYLNQMPPPPMLPPPSLKRRRSSAATAAVVLLAAAAGAGIGHVVWHSPNTTSPAAQSGQIPGFAQPTAPGFGGQNGQNGNPENGSGGTSGGGTEGSGGPSDVSSIAAGVDPGLVDVNSTFGYQSAKGAGTGIVLTSDGEILTNNHVIDGATAVSVTDIGNGKTYTATVVGYSAAQDIAVLQLQNASGLTTAKIGDSAQAGVGEAVVAIGNAGGVGGTPSSAGGSITALDQSISAADQLDGSTEQLSGLIQVNADIQEGDSGGSLVNASGQVIGIDTATSSQFSLQETGGQGYAIPINQAVSVADQIKAGHGSSTVHVGPTAFLGVLITPSSSQGNPGSGFGGSGSGSNNGNGGGNGGLGGSVAGADVSGILSGGAAQSAGLNDGDVITSLNGRTVGSSADLTTIVAALKPGDNVAIIWVDPTGQQHSGSIDLGSGPPA
jgi:S1-C subfamily serine protease